MNELNTRMQVCLINKFLSYREMPFAGHQYNLHKYKCMSKIPFLASAIQKDLDFVVYI